jgi:hypothetical protein
VANTDDGLNEMEKINSKRRLARDDLSRTHVDWRRRRRKKQDVVVGT